MKKFRNTAISLGIAMLTALGLSSAAGLSIADAPASVVDGSQEAGSGRWIR